MKSRTINSSLLEESLNPLPSCCVKTVLLSVGRKNNNALTLGTSMPAETLYFVLNVRNYTAFGILWGITLSFWQK